MESRLTLFPDWQGKITLPPSNLMTEKIGGNTIYQQAFRGARVNVSIAQSDTSGHYFIATKLEFPFDKLLLRKKGVRRVATNHLVLIAKDLDQLDEIDDETEFEWDDSQLLNENFSHPAQILESWDQKFSFREEDPENEKPGLRTPQIGALHAISAHFAVGRDHEAATVVLPTGTGKTETMLAMMVYRRPKKVLVIVPSTALRDQISKKFVTLGVLPFAQVVPEGLIGPKVAKLTKGISDLSVASELLESANVIVALPQTLSSCSSEVLQLITETCSDLIVDEAHHVPASQWSKIKDQFSTKRITQFTATPFRRDKKRVDGKIIFNFRLGDAQAADYYRPINLKTIEEFGEQALRDRAIAIEAIEALRKDRSLGLDHVLMARCRTKERAELVHKIYSELAPDLKPQLVYSGSGRTSANRIALKKIADRGADSAHVVVCVDMLGEGYDLPNLKVAALHDCHKSLAITLQFIGRFTRKGNWNEIGEATVVVNIADAETEEKLIDLYASGADWDGLIKRLSEQRIDEEINLQDVVEGLKANGTLHEQISLWNLKPSFSTQIFRTKCQEWSPLNYSKVLAKNAESWHALSSDGHLLVAVICRPARVRWGDFQNIEEVLYDLLIVRWDPEDGALFVYATDYDGLKSTTLAKHITDDETSLLQGPVIFNILNNVELPLVKNLGSSRIGAISFTSYFGPNVTEGLARIEKAQSELNNIACLGYEHGDRVIWGGTKKKGKVWQRAAGSIAKWIEWTEATWSKVSDEDEVDANITRDFLRPQKIDAPYSSYPIALEWGDQAQMGYSDKQFILFDEAETPFFLVDLELSEVEPDGNIVLAFSNESKRSEYRFKISSTLTGGYLYEHVAGPKIAFRRGNGATLGIEEYFVSDPPLLRYVDGTHSFNCYHIPTNLDPETFPRAELETWDFSGVPLNQESMGKAGKQDTIQYRAYQKLADEYDVIFNDDGKGEAADLVCFKDIDDETIRLTLVHCKNAHEAKVTNDIRNFYVVCGQAQKCISVKHGGIPRLYNNLKRRQNTWLREGADRFLKGDIRRLSYFKEKSRKSKLIFEVILVQPGGSKKVLSDSILTLLGTTDLFLKKTTLAEFRVIVSD